MYPIMFITKEILNMAVTAMQLLAIRAKFIHHTATLYASFAKRGPFVTHILSSIVKL